MKEVYLWTVYRATTNSPNDVWKKKDKKRHPSTHNSLQGKGKLRYTIPVFLLGKDKEGNKILLFLQTSTDESMPFDKFIIKSKQLSQYLRYDLEYIYKVNVRIGSSEELEQNSKSELVKFGKVFEEYRDDILSNSLSLIEGTPRYELINKIINSNHEWTFSNRINQIIKVEQYTVEERIYKGIYRDKKYNK